jgi:hypothetical protein
MDAEEESRKGEGEREKGEFYNGFSNPLQREREREKKAALRGWGYIPLVQFQKTTKLFLPNCTEERGPLTLFRRGPLGASPFLFFIY